MMNSLSSPSTVTFKTTLFLSTIMMLTSSNWIMLWMSMEINLMSFIPLILHSQKNTELEASTKYFLIQSIGSSILLLSIFMNNHPWINKLSPYLFMISLLLKMGAAPLHFWLPSMLNNMNWFMVLLTTTWQKLGPLIIMSYSINTWPHQVVMFMSVLNSFTGAWSGIKQTQMRPLMAYSSISHMGWMLASMLHSSSLLLTYFTMYSILSIMLVVPLLKLNKMKSSNFNLSSQSSYNSNTFIMLNFLSLGGMPPLLGFIPKWMVITYLINTSPLLTVLLVLTSLVSLFFYLKIFFNVFLNSYKSMLNKTDMSFPLMLIPQLIIPPMIMIRFMFDMLMASTYLQINDHIDSSNSNNWPSTSH